RGSGYSLVLERSADALTRGPHRRFSQVGVPIAPDPEHGADHRWRRFDGPRCRRCAARAIPVQRRREGARSGEIGNVTIDIDRVARPLAEQLPVLLLQLLFGDAWLPEESDVPRLLALLDRRRTTRRPHRAAA